MLLLTREMFQIQKSLLLKRVHKKHGRLKVRELTRHNTPIHLHEAAKRVQKMREAIRLATPKKI